MTTKTLQTAVDAQHHNMPGLPPLSPDEDATVEAGREALTSIKKTFENWLTIARALKALRDKADDIGGKFTFDHLREREGLGKELLPKGRVSRLRSILASEDDVVEWRRSLTANQQFEWASPEAVHRHCPVLAKEKPKDVKPRKGRRSVPIDKYEKVQQRVVELQEDVERLEVDKAQLDTDNAVLHRRLDKEAEIEAGAVLDDILTEQHKAAMTLLDEAMGLLKAHLDPAAARQDVFSPALYSYWLAWADRNAEAARQGKKKRRDAKAIEAAIAGGDPEPKKPKGKKLKGKKTKAEDDEPVPKKKKGKATDPEVARIFNDIAEATDKQRQQLFNHLETAKTSSAQAEPETSPPSAKAEPVEPKSVEPEPVAKASALQWENNSRGIRARTRGANVYEVRPQKDRPGYELHYLPDGKVRGALYLGLFDTSDEAKATAEADYAAPIVTPAAKNTKADGWSWQDVKTVGPDGKEYWTATSVVGSRGEVSVEPDFGLGGRVWLVMYMPNRMHPEKRKRLNRRAGAKTFEKGKAWAERHFTKHL